MTENPVTLIEALNKLAADVVVTTHREAGNNIYSGKIATVDPSLNFHPNKFIGLDDRLNNSTNSASGKPTTGVGSAINSLMITSLKLTGEEIKYKKLSVLDCSSLSSGSLIPEMVKV